MTQFEAKYYDGQSSVKTEVTLLVDDDAGLLTIQQMPQISFAFSELKVKPRIGHSARHIDMPDGASLETSENAVIDKLSGRWFADQNIHPHLLESNLKIVFACLIVLSVSAFSFIIYGIPALSKEITELLPIEADIAIGQRLLDEIDKSIMKPTALPWERQEKLNILFDKLSANEDREVFLFFRDGGKLGANAFALPDGTIILTDQLVELAEDEDLLTGILLHEIGHVKYRHSMQSIIHQAGLGATVFLLFGDVSSASSLIVFLPSLLMQNQYSKILEMQSDTYALQQMTTMGMDTETFADIMQKLQEQNAAKEAGVFLEYFSTHPATDERIKRFRDWQKEGGKKI